MEKIYTKIFHLLAHEKLRKKSIDLIKLTAFSYDFILLPVKALVFI